MRGCSSFLECIWLVTLEWPCLKSRSNTKNQLTEPCWCEIRKPSLIVNILMLLYLKALLVVWLLAVIDCNAIDCRTSIMFCYKDEWLELYFGITFSVFDLVCCCRKLKLWRTQPKRWAKSERSVSHFCLLYLVHRFSLQFSFCCTALYTLLLCLHLAIPISATRLIEASLSLTTLSLWKVKSYCGHSSRRGCVKVFLFKCHACFYFGIVMSIARLSVVCRKSIAQCVQSYVANFGKVFNIKNPFTEKWFVCHACKQ